MSRNLNVLQYKTYLEANELINYKSAESKVYKTVTSTGITRKKFSDNYHDNVNSSYVQIIF